MGWTPTEVLNEIRLANGTRLKSMAVWYGVPYVRYMGRRAGRDSCTLDVEGLRTALCERLEGKESR